MAMTLTYSLGPRNVLWMTFTLSICRSWLHFSASAAEGNSKDANDPNTRQSFFGYSHSPQPPGLYFTSTSAPSENSLSNHEFYATDTENIANSIVVSNKQSALSFHSSYQESLPKQTSIITKEGKIAQNVVSSINDDPLILLDKDTKENNQGSQKSITHQLDRRKTELKKISENHRKISGHDLSSKATQESYIKEQSSLSSGQRQPQQHKSNSFGTQRKEEDSLKPSLEPSDKTKIIVETKGNRTFGTKVNTTLTASEEDQTAKYQNKSKLQIVRSKRNTGSQNFKETENLSADSPTLIEDELKDMNNGSLLSFLGIMTGIFANAQAGDQKVGLYRIFPDIFSQANELWSLRKTFGTVGGFKYRSPDPMIGSLR